MKNSIDDKLLNLHEDGRSFVELDEHHKQVRVVFVWHDVYHAIEFYDKLIHLMGNQKEFTLTLRPKA